jgi:hypothetical protein
MLEVPLIFQVCTRAISPSQSFEMKANVQIEDDEQFRPKQNRPSS